MLFVIYDEVRKMCVGCKSIMCGEREEAYNFMCQFLLRNTQARPPEDVHAVSGDGFFSQRMVTDFGFSNAKYVADCFHLFETGLTDRFGEYRCGIIKSQLCRMIKVKTEWYFNSALGNARIKLSQLPVG